MQTLMRRKTLPQQWFVRCCTARPRRIPDKMDKRLHMRPRIAGGPRLTHEGGGETGVAGMLNADGYPLVRWRR